MHSIKGENTHFEIENNLYSEVNNSFCSVRSGQSNIEIEQPEVSLNGQSFEKGLHTIPERNIPSDGDGNVHIGLAENALSERNIIEQSLEVVINIENKEDEPGMRTNEQFQNSINQKSENLENIQSKTNRHLNVPIETHLHSQSIPIENGLKDNIHLEKCEPKQTKFDTSEHQSESGVNANRVSDTIKYEKKDKRVKGSPDEIYEYYRPFINPEDSDSVDSKERSCCGTLENAAFSSVRFTKAISMMAILVAHYLFFLVEDLDGVMKIYALCLVFYSLFYIQFGKMLRKGVKDKERDKLTPWIALSIITVIFLVAETIYVLISYWDFTFESDSSYFWIILVAVAILVITSSILAYCCCVVMQLWRSFPATNRGSWNSYLNNMFS